MTERKKTVSRKAAVVFVVLAGISVVLGVVAMVLLPMPPNMIVDIPLPLQKTSPLIIRTEKAALPFVVEVVNTPQTMARGMMFRHHMAQNHGMLFDFGERAQVVSFWMKNTLVPLDMLFIDKAGQVVHIVPNAKPLDETPIFSLVPVRAVLEINAGLSGHYGIEIGDKIDHAIFQK